MEDLAILNNDEQQEVLATVKKLQGLVAEVLNPDDFHKIKEILFRAVETEVLHRDAGHYGGRDWTEPSIYCEHPSA